VDYIFALWEHKQKKFLIGSLKDTPQASLVVSNDRSVLNLDPHYPILAADSSLPAGIFLPTALSQSSCNLSRYLATSNLLIVAANQESR
jgi:hypothetical protein